MTCTDNCTNGMVASSGSSPVTVTGLDLGVMYSVIINVFDGNQVVLRDQLVIRNITVSGKYICFKSLCYCTFKSMHVHALSCCRGI